MIVGSLSDGELVARIYEAHDEMSDSFPCPHCGSEVRAGASFCRACGASDDSGWNVEDLRADSDSNTGYNDEADDFDYDDFVRREFPEHAPPSAPQRLKQTVVAVILLLLCTALLLWQLT
jgi:hypothetical protein